MNPRTPPTHLSLKARILLALLRRRCLSARGLARYARDNTDYYAETLRDWDGARFEDLPLFTKAQARAISPYDLLSRRLAKKVFLYAETTGSSGSPTPAFFTRGEFHAATLLSYITPYHAMLNGVIKRNRTCVNGLAFGFTVAGMSFGDLLANLGGLVANTGSRSTLATPERIARAIARLRPSVIAATPGDFLAWMRIVREDHPQDYDSVVRNLQVLMSTAELCAASRVARIEEEFDIVHVEIYACVEGFFALPCPCGEKHILPAYHAELFDENLQPLGREGTGRFAFSNLLKRSTPLVRYLLDDWVTISASVCRYGFTTSIVPHGRYELTLPVDGGRIGTRHVEEVLFRHGLFGAYEVTVEADLCRATLEWYAGERCVGEPDVDALGADLRKLLSMPVDVRLVDFGTLVDPRAVRPGKPLLRVIDRRPVADQRAPVHM